MTTPVKSEGTNPPKQQVTNSSSLSVSSSSSLKRTVVTVKRKEELLLKARAERRRWIRTIPLPYVPDGLARLSNDAEEGTKDVSAAAVGATSRMWSSRDGLDKLQRSLICGNRFLPGATSVLSELYGIGGSLDVDEDEEEHDVNGDADNNNSRKKDPQNRPFTLDEVSSRVEQLAKPYWEDEQKERNDPPSFLEKNNENGVVVDENKNDNENETTNDVPKGETADGGSAANDDHLYGDVRKAYEEFADVMLSPESAVTVQGMKNFVRQFAATKKDGGSDDLLVRKTASVLNNQIRQSHESLVTKGSNNSNSSNNSTVANDAQSGEPDWDRRSLESFLYGQTKEVVEPTLDKILGNAGGPPSSSSPFSMTQALFDTRLEELQFLQPSHLEIACLNDDDSEGNHDGLDFLLMDPIKALRSVESFYSPYEKLRRVLDVFRGVNAALSKTSKTVPSADDVLPTVILVVVKAAAMQTKNKTRRNKHHTRTRAWLKNLLRDLYFVESFALPEYLRGEAGYAFTNLYGAVMFLQELQLEIDPNDGGKSNRLSISADDLRLGLEKSRAAAAKHHAKRKSALGGGNGDGEEPKGRITRGVEELLGEDDRGNSGGAEISNFLPTPLHLSAKEVRAARLRGETLDLDWALRQRKRQPEHNKPCTNEKGFSSSPTKSPSRSVAMPQRYTFLGVRPENVRVSDLPKLLDEYRKLALATEELLGEQQRANHKIQSERKRLRDEKHRRNLGERLLLS